MTKTILASLKGRKPNNKKVRMEIKKVITEYQRASGLTADGIPGRKTAESLAREIPILDISEISSTVLYPQKPMAELYVIPYETVEKTYQSSTRASKALMRSKNMLSLPKNSECSRNPRSDLLSLYTSLTG